MQKRKHEPQMPGSRNYRLREPVAPGLAAFLEALDLNREPDWAAARAEMLDYYASQRPHATSDELDRVAKAYDARAERLLARRVGSPGNNAAYTFVVAAALELECRLRKRHPLPGSVSARIDVARALGLVPDTVGKAWKAGRDIARATEQLKAAEVTHGDGHIAWAALTDLAERVARVWPQYRIHARRPN